MLHKGGRDFSKRGTSYGVTGRETAATRQTSFIGYFLQDEQVERYSARTYGTHLAAVVSQATMFNPGIVSFVGKINLDRAHCGAGCSVKIVASKKATLHPSSF